MSQGDLALLLRLNKSWHDGISAENLYEITRAWWVMSPANAQRVARVLAVADGVVREVYQPAQWLPSPVEGLENRIGFEGVVASDRETYVGRDVTHLFRPGSDNPVRYLPLEALIDDAVIAPNPAPKIPSAKAEQFPAGAVEPGLLERILPLLNAFENDLLWAQSRAGQGLGLVEMGLNYLGEAAESHACDGSIESSAWQLRDGIGRGELLVECLRRVDCLGQCNQAVSQCAIANELAARAPECIGVDLVECPG